MSRTIDTALFLRPLETQFYGRPRSFNAGESHHAESEFPPSPQAFQGLIRSQLLRAVKPPLDLDDWSERARDQRSVLVGEPGRLPEGWQIAGPLPARRIGVELEAGWPEERIEPWVAAPRFLLQGRAGGPVAAEPIASTHPALSDLGEDVAWLGRPRSGADCKPLSGWIGPDNLRRALAGASPETWDPRQHRRGLPPFVRKEAQPGIALDRDRNTARDAMLYRLDALRFEAGGGWYGRFSGALDERITDHALTDGAANAGRKGRVVAFEPAPEPVEAWRSVCRGEHLKDTDPGGAFWLLLLSPVHLADPRRPALHVTLPGGVRPVFRAALTGPPVVIGGYAMVGSRPRPNLAYVPAGSAWLFGLEGGSADQRRAVLAILNDGHVLGDPEAARFGFGHTLVGIGPK